MCMCMYNLYYINLFTFKKVFIKKKLYMHIYIDKNLNKYLLHLYKILYLV